MQHSFSQLSKLMPAATAALLLAALLLGLAGPAQAALSIYNNQAAWAAAVGAPTLIGFDDLADGTPVIGPYAGQTFSAFNGGNPMAMLFSLPQAGTHLLSLGTPPLTGGGGGVAVDFASPQAGVGFWYLDSEIDGNSVDVYAVGNLWLGNFPLALQLPAPTPPAWQFIGFSSSVGNELNRITVTIADGDMVALDSLQIAAVPEPGTAALTVVGIWALLLRAQIRRRP
ncbi:PEP-CTERM sorting domain-containing protein [Roseateles sp.]|uniref:PEP-CTERM sorting domain-containing protein n=1 Tax=Roseateles sp. TaxID=1971397 RepID=UPI00286A0E1A|nr:PEP-CTERM sorting domain-containing protein [Roseateles sp.]